MNEPKQSAHPPKKPGKITAPVAVGTALTAGLLIYFAILFRAGGSSGASSSEAVSSADSGSSRSVSAQAASSGSAVSVAGTVSSFPASSASGGASGSTASEDEYALPAETSGQPSASSAASGAEKTGAITNSTPAEQTQPSAENTEQPSSSESGSAAPQADRYSGKEISREEFNSLQKGMTLAEVETAVGGSGTLQSDYGKTKVYQWTGYGSPDSYAQLTFKSGKLTYKIQFGL